MRALACLGLIVASWLAPRAAHASLAADAARVADALAAGGARIAPRQRYFLEEGRLVELPPLPTDAPCATVVLISERSVGFSVAISPRAGRARAIGELRAAEPGTRQDSLAGLVALAFCEEERAQAAHVVARMRSRRGAIEVVVASSSRPAPEIDPAWIARAREAAAPRGNPGPPLSVAPLADRRREAEARARGDGASNILPLEMRTGESGTGDLTMRLPPGCHRFDVLPDVPNTARTRGFDADADLIAEDGTLLARDRGETADARVETCVGRVSEVTLKVAGAPVGARVLVMDAIWPLASFLPERWGPRVRASLATALRRRRVPEPTTGPLLEVLGAQGTSQTRFEVEPGRCYLAAVALMRGPSRGLRLAATASGRTSVEEVSGAVESIAVTFCADGRPDAALLVDAPGASIWWVLAVWPLGTTAPTLVGGAAPHAPGLSNPAPARVTP